MRNWTKLLFELCRRGGNSFAYTPGVKRLTLTAAALLGASLSAAALSVFLFGCCVLPFHRYVHRIMPLCGGIVRALGHNTDQDATPPATRPARRPAVAKALAPDAPASVDVRVSRLASMPPPASLRNVISLGALRCDDDVGLHLLLTTLLI